MSARQIEKGDNDEVSDRIVESYDGLVGSVGNRACRSFRLASQPFSTLSLQLQDLASPSTI